MNNTPDYDVAVIGGGNAALCAAIAARRAGARVVVLERAPRDFRGGNSRHTRNFRCLHTTPGQYLTGTYTEDEFLSDLAQCQRRTRSTSRSRAWRSSSRRPARSGWRARACAFRPRCTARCSLAAPISSFLAAARR